MFSRTWQLLCHYGHSEKSKEGEMATIMSINICIFTIFSHLKVESNIILYVWSGYCIYVTEILCFLYRIRYKCIIKLRSNEKHAFLFILYHIPAHSVHPFNTIQKIYFFVSKSKLCFPVKQSMTCKLLPTNCNQ